MLTIVLTALKAIPVKDWLYGSAIAALLGGGAYLIHHERTIGAQRVQAADQKAAQAQEVHNAEIESRAKALVSGSALAYKAALSSPPASDAPTVLVCSQPATASDTVPGNASSRPLRHGEPAVPEPMAPVGEQTVEHAVDIGPETDQRFHTADAQVTALQAYIRACQEAGICAK